MFERIDIPKTKSNIGKDQTKGAHDEKSGAGRRQHTHDESTTRRRIRLVVIRSPYQISLEVLYKFS